MGEAAGRNREEPCLLLLVPTAAAGSVYAGWGASHFAELWYVFDHLDQSAWNWTVADRKLADTMSSYWSTWRDQAIRTTRVFRRGRRLPTRSARFNIWAIRSPLEVANIHGLSVFDSVDTAVRGEPFAAR
jgi:para-nitrobenzyl esterase